MSETRELLQYREPGMYEIRLKGHLDSRWSHKFESMSFTHKTDGTTVLSGPLADQSELHGLLRKLRDLGLSLISINQMDSNQAIGSDGNAGKTN
ncbi:hypothetical protein [Bacillus sp. FJAT-27445]|uniref:hypothetical protein n=1 Tax=Bacillus sp. FJAT-27445 TaxID=1679166 RepID=UPI000A5DAED1|nr:hypothetical protein [Bacillus sp. FJAT-27445]